MRKHRLIWPALAIAVLAMRVLNGTSPAAEIFLIANHGTNETSGPKTLGAAFNGTNFLIGLQGDAASGHNIVVQFVSTNGVLVGSPLALNRTGGTPAAAFDGTNHLVVWPDDADPSGGDIYGQLISTAGTLVGNPIPICTREGEQAFYSFKPVAFGGANYLVVWEDPRAGSSNVDIYGQLVSPSGALVGGEIPLSIEPGRQREPAVAFNGANFLVTWLSRRSGDPELWDTQGRLVSPSGALGPVLQISQAPSPSNNPSGIATDGAKFLVVWNRDIGPGFPAPTVWDVYGRFVNGSGSLAGDEFPIATAAGSQVFPSVGYDGANFLVSWFDEPASNAKFRYFTPSGQGLGEEFTVFAPQGSKMPIAVVGPFDGARFLTLANLAESGFQNSDLYGSFILGSTARPRLDFTNGQFPLRLTGTPGQNYAIQATTNLNNSPTWIALSTNNAASGTFSFTDPNATNLNQIFYRAMLVP